MWASSLRFAALALLPSSALGAQLSPDGFVRDTVVPNGTFPGPTFKLTKGDSVVIHTHNQLTSPDMRRSTSIHWHGFFQARTSGMDGPSARSHPAPPLTTFFDTAGQTGNYWYHSHLSTQYCDGLRGAFVVYGQRFCSSSISDSTIITLAEWYRANSFFKTGIVPVQDSGLINGKGRYAWWPPCIAFCADHPCRFRVFSLSCRPFMTLSFDNHTFDVIELDGVEHDPVAVPKTQIYMPVSQRISIVLNANQTVGNYWPTGGSAANKPELPTLRLPSSVTWELPAVEPTTVNIPGAKLDDGLMHPIASEGPGNLGSGPADLAVTLNIAQPNAPFFDINGISYLFSSLPVLLQLLSGAAKPTDFLPSEQVIILKPNAIIDISIPGGGDHPFHCALPFFPPNAVTPNYVNPARRDVQPINGGNTTFRFFSNNPGAWFLHCPAANIAGPQSQIQTDQWKALCPTYDNLAPEFQ
ncbi:laccase 3 [Mycena olivaceomarginata]|nr:laccase 3 [Mycena olivaceomarginata]